LNHAEQGFAIHKRVKFYAGQYYARRAERHRHGLLVGLREQSADAGRFGLLGDALGFGFERGVRRCAGVEDRLAEIAGQRRPERRRLSR
jgi:hypothetical protein